MEYSNNFEGNITPDNFNNQTIGILNWIKENRDKFDWAKDPNCYELSNIFLFAGKYIEEGHNIDVDTLKEIWEIRKNDFANVNIDNNSFIYKICEDSFNSAINGKSLVNDENSHASLRKMSSIGLYLMQQKRDIEKGFNNNISYDNINEYNQLEESSKYLNLNHPDLFEKYKFSNNLNMLGNLVHKKDLENNNNEFNIDKTENDDILK